MKIVPTDRLEWPPPYKSATEKYSPQVTLAPDGALKGYSAGLAISAGRCERSPGGAKGDVEFQLPSALHRRRDLEERRNSELQTRLDGGRSGRAFHNRQRRILQQYRTHRGQSDPDRSEAKNSGIRYRFGAYPFLEPAEMRGFGFIRYRSLDPKVEDNSWMMNPRTRQRGARRPANSQMCSVCSTRRRAAAQEEPDLREQPRSGFVFRLRREDRRFQLQVPRREADAGGGERGELAGQGLPHRRRTQLSAPRTGKCAGST